MSIENFLRHLSAPAGRTSEFDRLPIPYRAVATDIETSEKVVLDRGSLMRAMRANMAIPGALTPVEIDGCLLVDGGIANNLPILARYSIPASEYAALRRGGDAGGALIYLISPHG